MTITLNGKEQTFAKNTTLEQIVLETNLDKNHLVIEFNKKVIDINKIDEIIIQEGDSIEIIAFVGGG